MPTDREIAANADPEFQQHFLVSEDKLAKLISTAGIRPTDDVLEVGAGIGTVPREFPKSRSLTLVELDDRLTGALVDADLQLPVPRELPAAAVVHAPRGG